MTFPLYVCMYICMYVCIYVCMYVCVYVCMYVCMYVYSQNKYCFSFTVFMSEDYILPFAIYFV